LPMCRVGGWLKNLHGLRASWTEFIADKSWTFLDVLLTVFMCRV